VPTSRRPDPPSGRRRSPLLAAVLILFSLAGAPAAQAAGGDYAFAGGSSFEQRQVERALDASAFDWSLVRARVVIHIQRGVASEAAPGEIWLDADLLDAGTFAWGVVQHEYAHQVDFFLLREADRSSLLTVLGGVTWCAPVPGLSHSDYGCERFASTLAWSFWPVPQNCMRPGGPRDESAALPPRAFRALLERLTGTPNALSAFARNERGGLRAA
jgi:hypothetical protein